MTDVAVPAAPALSTVPGVELMRTGTWAISTGLTTFTADDLTAAVAALDCPGVRRPVIKLGHVDPRFDGEPAIGYIANMATTASAAMLVGDYAGMPAWLTPEVLASAWPDRSIEGEWNWRCQIGHLHPFVVTAVALLGVSPPGIGGLESIQDIATLYGVAAAAGGSATSFTVRAADFEQLHPRGEHGKFRIKVGSTLLKLEAAAVQLTAYDDDTIDLSYDLDGGPVNVTLTGDAASALGSAVSGIDESDPADYPVSIPNGDHTITVSREEDDQGVVGLVEFGDGTGIEVTPDDGNALRAGVDEMFADIEEHNTSHVAADDWQELENYAGDGQLVLNGDRGLGFALDPNAASPADQARSLSTEDTTAFMAQLQKLAKQPAGTSATFDLTDGPVTLTLDADGVIHIDIGQPDGTGITIDAADVPTVAKAVKAFLKSGVKAAMPAPNTIPVAAGVSVEDVRRAYYDGPGSQDYDAWICEMLLDPLQLIVSGDSGYLRVDVTVNADGTVTFAAPIAVQMTYTPVPPGDGSTTVAAGRVVYASRKESRPPSIARRPRAAGPSSPAPEPEVPAETEPEGGAPVALDLDGLRSRLGLPADADEATINAAIAAPPEPAPVPAAASALPAGVVPVDQATLDDLRAQAAQGVQARAQQLTEKRDRVISDAVRAGKITPARRGHWETAWAADADGAEQALASLAPGLVPVDGLTGVTGGDEATGDEAVYQKLYPNDGSKGA